MTSVSNAKWTKSKIDIDTFNLDGSVRDLSTRLNSTRLSPLGVIILVLKSIAEFVRYGLSQPEIAVSRHMLGVISGFT